MQSGRGTGVVAFVPDLMDRSKVSAALPQARFVTRPHELVGCEADLVIVDLGRPGVIAVLGELGARRVVGFASHVDRATIEAARAAGGEVMVRSEFFRSLPLLES